MDQVKAMALNSACVLCAGLNIAAHEVVAIAAVFEEYLYPNTSFEALRSLSRTND